MNTHTYNLAVTVQDLLQLATACHIAKTSCRAHLIKAIEDHNKQAISTTLTELKAYNNLTSRLESLVLSDPVT